MHLTVTAGQSGLRTLIIIMTYIYRALINALSAHMIHINLNMIFFTHVEHRGHLIFIPAQLSTDTVSILRKVWVLHDKTVDTA